MSIVLVLVTLFALTPLFYYLPEATLRAVVIHAVWGLRDVGETRRYWLLRRTNFVPAQRALLGMLVFDILPVLLLAMVLSLVLLIYRASRSQGSILGKVPGKHAYSDIARHPENETVPGLFTFRINAPMFFANNAPLRERLKEMIRTTEPRPGAILLDMTERSQFRDQCRTWRADRLVPLWRSGVVYAIRAKVLSISAVLGGFLFALGRSKCTVLGPLPFPTCSGYYDLSHVSF